MFRLMRIPVLGELLAPLVSVIFWRVAMRYAVQTNQGGSREIAEEFHASFSGLRGAWRLMAVLRFGDPATVLASVPEMLPHLLIPTLIFQGSRDTAVPKHFALRAGALISAVPGGGSGRGAFYSAEQSGGGSPGIADLFWRDCGGGLNRAARKNYFLSSARICFWFFRMVPRLV